MGGKVDGAEMIQRMGILGSGAWALAMARVVGQKTGQAVSLWCPRATTAELLIRERGNPALLPGVTLPDSVTIETDGVRALDGCSMLLVAVPTAYLGEVLRERARVVPPDLPVVSLVKGIETGSLDMPSGIIRREWGSRRVAVLSGPSHAEEVARGLPAAVVVASSDEALALSAQERIMTDRFRVYTNADMTGVEWAGALKNVIGIAAGICDGLELGDNAKAAMLTRGLAEIARSGGAMGADQATFSGLAGVGDLLTTCFSPHGRNRRLGRRIGRGETLEAALGTGGQVVEGVNTVRALAPLARSRGWDMPICQGVHDVLFGGKSPRHAVEGLLLRAPRPEFIPKEG